MTTSSLIQSVTTKRDAIAEVKALANLVIEQNERWAKGWDKGTYRDDDTERHCSAKEQVGLYTGYAFHLAQQHA